MFGRHVDYGAHRGSRAGEIFLRNRRSPLSIRSAIWLLELAGVVTFGQTEIQNLGVPTLGHEDIRRLDVAMDDALRHGRRPVRRRSRLPAKQRLQLQSAGYRSGASGCAFQVLHGDECLAVLVADVMDGADVGMIESRRRFASRRKRSKDGGSWAMSSGRNFSATKRSRRVSSALYTTPIPPPPTFSTMR